MILFLLHGALFSDIKSTSGNISFNLNNDGTREMILSSQGLGLNITVPSSNLHVAGNAIISSNIAVGAGSGNTKLQITGSLGMNIQTVTSDKILSNNTMIFADSSSSNLSLILPTATSASGRAYSIKKISTSNDVYVTAGTNGTNIDNQTVLALNSGNLGYMNLVSSSSNWHLLSMSEPSLGGSAIGINSNLVGWWKLDETSGTTATDSSTSAKNGTLSNSTFAANSIAGKIDTGLAFSGSANLNFSATTAIVSTPFSVVFWFMDTGSSPGAGIFGKYRKPYGDYNTEVDWHFAFAPSATSPYYQAKGNTDIATGNTSPNWPSHQTDDIGLLIVQTVGDEANSVVTANGFALVNTYTSGAGAGSTKIRMYWCRATSGAMAAPVLGDAGDHIISKIITFRGCVSSGNPWDTYAGGSEAADTTLSIPALTTSVNKTIIFYASTAGQDGGIACISGNVPVNATLTNLTELYDETSAINAFGGQIYGWSGNMSEVGSTGTLTCTIRNTQKAYIAMALKSDTSTEVGSGNIGLLISNAAGSSYTHQTVLAPTANTWYHLACTYDGATAKAFVNGALVASEAWAGTPGTEYHLRASGNNDSLFSGRLDDIRLYNAAIGANVIDALYHIGNAGY